MRIKPNHKTHHRFHVSDLTHRWWTLLFPEIQTLVGNLVKQQIRLGELLFFSAALDRDEPRFPLAKRRTTNQNII